MGGLKDEITVTINRVHIGQGAVSLLAVYLRVGIITGDLDGDDVRGLNRFAVFFEVDVICRDEDRALWENGAVKRIGDILRVESDAVRDIRRNAAFIGRGIERNECDVLVSVRLGLRRRSFIAVDR